MRHHVRLHFRLAFRYVSRVGFHFKSNLIPFQIESDFENQDSESQNPPY